MNQHFKPVEREGRSPRCVDAFVLFKDGREIAVTIINISNRGGLIQGIGCFAAGDQVRVEVPRLGGLWAQIRWAANGNAGVEFVPDSDLWERQC